MCTAGFDSGSDSEEKKIKESHSSESAINAITDDDSLQLETVLKLKRTRM